jgi:hypothetical protein
MGQSIQIAGAAFSKIIASLTLPDRSDLIAEYIFGVDFASSSRNLANPDLPLLEVGVPTYGDNYARVASGSGGYGFNTQVVPVPDCTLLNIRGPSSAPSASTYLAGKTNLGFYHRSNNYIVKGGTYADLSHGAVNNGTADAWSFAAGVTTHADGFARHFRGNAATGVLTEGVAANARTGTSTTGSLYIGTEQLSSTVADVQCSHAYFAAFNRLLTAAEIDAAYQTLRVFFARRGIAI